MSYRFKNIVISKLSVIGAGQIGPDICLHFAKVFSGSGVELVLVDISEQALDAARAGLEKKINTGVEARVFKPDMAAAMINSITSTSDYQQIAGWDIVLEAATEDENVKDLIFKQVEDICDSDCLFLSNSSHMQPETIFRNIRNQRRCLVTHYFFPAERNPIVEIVPGDKTDPEITGTLLGLYEAMGKVPIRVKSSYGYAVDPIFEGLCQTAIMCLEKGYGTVKEIDSVAVKTLGLGVGPFTALTLTGGNPITDHGLDEMNRFLMPWFRSPDALREAVKKNMAWDIAKRGERTEVTPDKEAVLGRQFLGAYFGLASYVIDLDICDISDLNMACEIALVMNAPFSMMNDIGIENAHAMVKAFCEEHGEFPFPASLDEARQRGGWELSSVLRATVGDVAILTIRRPKVLNALNSTTMKELGDRLAVIENDPTLVGAVLTGFGTKAFVSGADIAELAACRTPEDGYETSRTFQDVCNRVQNLAKPVVCALNGFAFGGGSELALACRSRICRKGMRVVACQPEVNLGFIPGAGGTQRLPRLIGIDKAAELLRTGRPVSSTEALEIGLVDREVEDDLIEEAIATVRQIASGKLSTKTIPKEPLPDIGAPGELDIDHLSRRIDGILTRAIYEGAGLSLEEGLELEARLFGECINTEDMKIGLENFKTRGPRAKATFVHR